jgi:peptidoglycan/LPS O-acetylase OafA/YrhL
MNKSTSIYLDVVRIVSALTVYADHLGAKVTNIRPIWGFSGHVAVIAFFVLSGYVIAFVSSESETTIRVYSVKRAARIYSGAIPAMILTIIVDNYISITGGVHLSYEYHDLFLYIPIFLTFSYEFWVQHTTMFSNGPFWSLSNEVWYYIAFAVLIFASGRRRILLLGGIAIMVGPRLLMLAPPWFLGTQIYAWHNSGRDLPWPRTIFFGSLCVLALIRISDVDEILMRWYSPMIGDWFHWKASGAESFLTDYVDAVFIGSSILSVQYCKFDLGRISAIAKTLAGFTFTFYLIHYPVLDLTLVHWHWSWPVATFAVFAATWIIGVLCEKRKKALAAIFDRIWERFSHPKTLEQCLE